MSDFQLNGRLVINDAFISPNANAKLRSQLGSFNAPQVSRLTSDLDNLADAVKDVDFAEKKAEKSAKESNKERQRTTRVTREAASAIEDFGDKAGLALRRFAAFSIAAGSVFGFFRVLKDGIKDSLEFNRSIVKVAQVTETSVASLKGLRGEINRLSADYGVLSGDLQRVALVLAQAGLSAQDTKQSLEALAQSTLAPTFKDIDNTTEGAIAAFNQFNLTAKDLGATLGIINSVSAKYAVESDDIVAAIRKAGGAFSAANKGVADGNRSLAEFVALFTSVRATTRESADSIATGLRTISTRLQRPETIQFLREFGVELTDLEGKFVGPFRAAQILGKALQGLDTRDLRFSAIVEELGGYRQVSRAIPFIKETAKQTEALNIALNGQNSIAKSVATVQGDLSFEFSKVREEFSALLRELANTGTIQTLLSLTIDLSRALINLAESAKDVLPIVGLIAAGRGISALAGALPGFGIRALTGQPKTPIRRQSGGMVPGIGIGDKIPALLEPGEFVLNRRAVSVIGLKRLEDLNGDIPRFGPPKKYQRGGMIPGFSTGSRRGRNVKDLDTFNELFQSSLTKNEAVAPSSAPPVLPFDGAEEYVAEVEKLTKIVFSVRDSTKKWGISLKEVDKIVSRLTRQPLGSKFVGLAAQQGVLAAIERKEKTANLRGGGTNSGSVSPPLPGAWPFWIQGRPTEDPTGLTQARNAADIARVESRGTQNQKDLVNRDAEIYANKIANRMSATLKSQLDEDEAASPAAAAARRLNARAAINGPPERESRSDFLLRQSQLREAREQGNIDRQRANAEKKAAQRRVQVGAAQARAARQNEYLSARNQEQRSSARNVLQSLGFNNSITVDPFNYGLGSFGTVIDTNPRGNFNLEGAAARRAPGRRTKKTSTAQRLGFSGQKLEQFEQFLGGYNDPISGFVPGFLNQNFEDSGNRATSPKNIDRLIASRNKNNFGANIDPVAYSGVSAGAIDIALGRGSKAPSRTSSILSGIGSFGKNVGAGINNSRTLRGAGPALLAASFATSQLSSGITGKGSFDRGIGALSGAVSGAAAGSLLGPFGILGGALIGGLTGLFDVLAKETENKIADLQAEGLKALELFSDVKAPGRSGRLNNSLDEILKNNSEIFDLQLEQRQGRTQGRGVGDFVASRVYQQFENILDGNIGGFFGFKSSGNANNSVLAEDNRLESANRKQIALERAQANAPIAQAARTEIDRLLSAGKSINDISSSLIKASTLDNTDLSQATGSAREFEGRKIVESQIKVVSALNAAEGGLIRFNEAVGRVNEKLDSVITGIGDRSSQLLSGRANISNPLANGVNSSERDFVNAQMALEQLMPSQQFRISGGLGSNLGQEIDGTGGRIVTDNIFNPLLEDFKSAQKLQDLPSSLDAFIKERKIGGQTNAAQVLRSFAASRIGNNKVSEFILKNSGQFEEFGADQITARNPELMKGLDEFKNLLDPSVESLQKFLDGIEKMAEALDKELQERNRLLDNLRSSRAREIDVQQQGAGILNSAIGGPVQRDGQFIRAQVDNLVDPMVRLADRTNPAAIGDRILSLRNQRERAVNDRTLSATDRVTRVNNLDDAISRNTKALEFLSDNVTDLAYIQDKLAEIQRQREVGGDKLRNILGAGPEELVQRARQQAAFEIVQDGKGVQGLARFGLNLQDAVAGFDRAQAEFLGPQEDREKQEVLFNRRAQQILDPNGPINNDIFDEVNKNKRGQFVIQDIIDTSKALGVNVDPKLQELISGRFDTDKDGKLTGRARSARNLESRLFTEAQFNRFARQNNIELPELINGDNVINNPKNPQLDAALNRRGSIAEEAKLLEDLQTSLGAQLTAAQTLSNLVQNTVQTFNDGILKNLAENTKQLQEAAKSLTTEINVKFADMNINVNVSEAGSLSKAAKAEIFGEVQNRINREFARMNEGMGAPKRGNLDRGGNPI